jgi:hypothetical protein
VVAVCAVAAAASVHHGRAGRDLDGVLDVRVLLLHEGVDVVRVLGRRGKPGVRPGARTATSLHASHGVAARAAS